jgi:hypothetical protein
MANALAYLSSPTVVNKKSFIRLTCDEKCGCQLQVEINLFEKVFNDLYQIGPIVSIETKRQHNILSVVISSDDILSTVILSYDILFTVMLSYDISSTDIFADYVSRAISFTYISSTDILSKDILSTKISCLQTSHLLTSHLLTFCLKTSSL